MDNTLSNINFTEPINKSNNTGLKQQEDFPKEELKGTQSTNDWENKVVVFQKLSAVHWRSWSEAKQSRTAISDKSTVRPPLGHKELSNPRLTALKQNISKESGDVQLPNSVKTTDNDPGSQ